jgi:hypothetical protein
MSDQPLTQDELDQEQAANLPDRENMSVVQPVNQIVASNFMADGIVTEATASQDAPITQTGG